VKRGQGEGRRAGGNQNGVVHNPRQGFLLGGRKRPGFIIKWVGTRERTSDNNNGKKRGKPNRQLLRLYARVGVHPGTKIPSEPVPGGRGKKE